MWAGLRMWEDFPHVETLNLNKVKKWSVYQVGCAYYEITAQGFKEDWVQEKIQAGICFSLSEHFSSNMCTIHNFELF
jgi:hypothetical protein